MNNLGALGVTIRWGGALAVLILAQPSWAQECQIDDDCGHGFQCIHDSAGTATVTGGIGGTSSSAVCGDAICDFISEDVESCPQDCDTIQYCAVAECSSDADCAEGYECGAEVGSNSGFTSAGGTSSSVCGDGVCDFDETNASCPDDCRLYRLCQPKQVACMSDDDCADGFYCYLDSGANNVSVAVSSVDSTSGTDTATNGSDTATGSGGNVGSGSDGAQDTAGFAPIPPADTGTDTAGGDMGVCLPNSSDGTTGGSTGTVNNVATVGSVTTGGDTAGTDAADSATTDAGETGTSASSGNGSGGATSQNSSVVGSGTDSSSSDGASNGGAGDGSSTGGGDDSGTDDDAGCSCAVAGAGGWSGGLLLTLLGFVAVGGRRLRVRRR